MNSIWTLFSVSQLFQTINKETNKQEMHIREKTFGIKTETTTKINACFCANPESPDSGYNRYPHQWRKKKQTCLRKIKQYFKNR